MPKQRELVAQGHEQAHQAAALAGVRLLRRRLVHRVLGGQRGRRRTRLLTLQLVAIIVGSLIVIGFGGVPERRTQLGSEVLEHLQGLREYLTIAEADRLKVLQSPQGAQRTRIDPSDPAAVVRLYEKLLPWAIVWGVEDQWGEVLGEQYAQTQTEPLEPAVLVGIRRAQRLRDLGADDELRADRVDESSYSSSGGGSSFSSGSSGGGFSGGGGGGGGGGGR